MDTNNISLKQAAIILVLVFGEIAPMQLMPLGVIELLGATWTYLALRRSPLAQAEHQPGPRRAPLGPTNRR